MDTRQGIEVTTYLGGKFKHANVNITVVVDGVTHRVPFGQPFIETPPGPHTVSVYWGTQPKKARPTTDVTVPLGAPVRLRWDGPRFIWQAGKLSPS